MSAGQGTEPDGADCGPGQPLHVQMKICRHPPDLPVFSFAEDEVVTAWLDRPDRAGPEDITIVRYSAFRKQADRFRSEFARKTDPVGFFHFVTGMRQPGDEIAVVGKQDQSFAVLVQPAGGNQTGGFCLRDEVDRFFGCVPVFQRADVTARLVQHDIELFRLRNDQLSVEFHPVARPDPFASAFRGPAVDGDLTRGDQFFRTPPGADAAAAEIFGQADAIVIHDAGQSF